MDPETKSRERPPAERGIALPVVLIFSLVATWFAASLFQILSTHGTIAQDNYNSTRALYLAESGLNRCAEALWVAYLNSSAQPDGRIAWLEANYNLFDQTDQPVGDDGDKYSVRVVKLLQTGDPESRYVVMEATGKAAGSHIGSSSDITERTITRVMRYGNDQSSIFDYVYFINNFGWFWGSTITANGDVRANGDFSFKYNPLVNGDAYASVNPDVGASGDVIDGGYRTWDLATYRSNAEPHWRPTFPEFEFGYDGTSQTYQQQDVLEMPYLADFDHYVQLAQNKGGTLTTADVNIVYSATGPLFLFGTPDNPIQLNGPVAISGDVVIAGYISGQGTIYAERNVHIIGDIVYTNPPMWDHSEGADPADVADHNSAADFLGLAAKGSVLMGDYTNTGDWYNYVKYYLKPPFTTSYTDEDGSINDGDYTKVDGTKLDGSPRKMYESTFDDSTFQSFVNQAVSLFGHDHKPRQIDALIYTNHVLSGRVKTCNFNGAVISRDEAIVYNNWINLNFDYRAKVEGENYIDINLPRSANATPVIWLDGPYTDWAAKIDALEPDTGV